MLTRMNAAVLPREFSDSFCNTGDAGARRVYLALGSAETRAPVAFGGRVLQHVRIIVMVPGGASERLRSERLIGPLPCLPAPQQRVAQAGDGNEVMPRPVRGEILRDDCGRFYERIGMRIRPIAELAASTDGKPLAVEKRARIVEREATNVHGATRMLFAPPGLWRVVAFGEFRPMLAPQIAHPQRLRDSHQVPCYLQVYQALADMPLQRLVEMALGAGAAQDLVQPWSDAAAARLQISLPPLHERREETPRTAGTIRAGSRFFRLHVASDPTADAASTEPIADHAPSRAPATKAATTPSSGRSENFAVSREEAVYDLQLAASREGWLRRLSMRVAPPAKRAELRKWQALIAGKSLQQQLWEVRPPLDGLRDPRVRRWIAEAIRLAGPDAQATLDEWEIYWRRKGMH